MVLRWYHWVLLASLVAGAAVGLVMLSVLGLYFYAALQGIPAAAAESLVKSDVVQNGLGLVEEGCFVGAVAAIPPFRRLAAPLWRVQWQDVARFAWRVPTAAVIAFGGNLLFSLVVARLGGDASQPEVQSSIEHAAQRGTLALWFSALLMVVVAPLAEEYLFRGALFAGLRQRLPFWASALISAFVFAAAHLSPGLLLPLAWVGLVNAYLVERTGKLWPAILVHACNNALIFSALAHL